MQYVYIVDLKQSFWRIQQKAAIIVPGLVALITKAISIKFGAKTVATFHTKTQRFFGLSGSGSGISKRCNSSAEVPNYAI